MSLSFALRHLRYLRQSGVVGRCAFAVVAATCLSLLFPAQGVTASGTAPTQRVQATGEAQAFDIPAGPLAASLNALSRAAGLTLAVDSAEVAGKTAPAVSGAFTPQQALERLLAGSGLRHRFTNSTTVTLEPVVARVGEDGLLELGPIRVEGEGVDFGPDQIGNLPPPFPGGQVATGARVGLLGNRNIFDTPFSQLSFTEQLIESRQSQALEDVLLSSPAVRNQTSRSEAGDTFTVRGFQQSRNSTQFDGFIGVVPARRTSIKGIERVELLLGPSALLNGLQPFGSIGGQINLVPKRATSEPVTQGSIRYVSDSNFGGEVDVGRRFGPDNSFSARINVTGNKGGLGIDFLEREGFTVNAALDYEGERFRAQGNFAYIEDNFTNQAPFIGVSPGFKLPSVPENSESLALNDDFDRADHILGTVRAEYDVTEQFTLSAGYAQSRYQQEFFGGFFNIVNSEGDSDGFGGGIVDFAEQVDSRSGELGARADLEFAGMRHQVALVGTILDQDTSEEVANQGGPFVSNIFNPVRFSVARDNPREDLPDRNITLSGLSLVDTVSFLGDRIQLTGGIRYQKIEAETREVGTGALLNSYNESVISPAFAFTVKPLENLSLYGNYVEGLSQGGTAPLSAANAGENLAPIESEQFEIGAKYDFGSLAATLSFFQIKRPSQFTDPATNVFGQFGEQRNRGVEFVVFGEPVDGLRVLGGFSYVDAKLIETGDLATNGEQALGVASWLANIELEADIPVVKGLSAFGRVVYTGDAPLDFEGQQTVDEWVRLDLGANYSFNAGGQDLVARFAVNNVLDSNYFIARTDPGIVVSEPRTFLATLTIDF